MFPVVVVSECQWEGLILLLLSKLLSIGLLPPKLEQIRTKIIILKISGEFQDLRLLLQQA